MCGIEKAGFEQNDEAMERAIGFDVMLHAYMFMQSGIPVLYSGDEIGQVNDYTYKEDPNKVADSRYIHRGKMNWTLAKNVANPETVEGKLFARLEQLIEIRKREKAFVSNADTWTIDTGDTAVLCIGRYFEGNKIIGLFNFSEFEKRARISQKDDVFEDLITGQQMKLQEVTVPPYGFYYFREQL